MNKRVKNKSKEFIAKFARKKHELPSVWSLIKDTLRSLLKYKKVIFIIGLIQVFVSSVIRLFMISDPIQAGTYVSFITIIGFLAFVWAIRHLENDEPFEINDAFYQGTASLVKFLLLLMIISLQLIPFSLGAFIFATAALGQIVGTIDIIFLSSVWILLGLPTFYWITSSLIAIFIVTLPGTKPIESLKRASEITKGRRLTLFKYIGVLLIVSLLILILFLLMSAFLPENILLFTILGSQFNTPQILQYLVTTFFVLPLAITYLYKVYVNLIEGSNEKARS